MKIDFNQVVDRKNTNSLKYDFAAERGKSTDILPLWVADMDFPTVPAVTDALINASKHGIFGYSESKIDYFHVLEHWFQTHHNWSVAPNWLVKSPGIVFAIATAVQAYTKPLDSIIIQRPVYYPFSNTIINNQRNLVNNPLVFKNGTYEIDYMDFEQKIIDHKVKMFILCNPHNPVGRVWTSEELLTLGDICLKHKVLVVSDEIHADFTYPGHTHMVFANLKPEFLDITITCTAPSKTFNLAGLQISNIWIGNTLLKEKFTKAMDNTGYCEPNSMGLIACKAAYQQGEEWLADLKEYLLNNLNYIKDFLRINLPMLKLIEPEGTYLIWIDFRELNLSSEDLEDLIVNKANLWLDAGTMFGSEGNGFQRINIACPRTTLEKAMNQLLHAIRN